MKNKNILIKAATIGILSSFILTACGASSTGTASTAKPAAAKDGIAALEDSALMEEIYDNFEPLTKIYRETYHEKEVSDYLRDWAEKKSYQVTQDSANNIIIEVPATESLEDKPLTILQVHMDMVVAVKEGVEFDPKTDTIKLVREGNILKGENTNIGADDGSGIAIVQTLLDNSTKHGPLRVIITTDEEQTQSGLAAMDPAFAKDATYLINVDSEESDTITVSAASAITVEAERKVTAEAPKGDTVLELSIKGGAGGHSGLMINGGILNCLVSMNDLLYQIEKAGISYQIASVESGSAKNAIPSEAVAVIVTASSNAEKITEMVESYDKLIKESYGEKNPNLACAVAYPNLIVESVMSAADAKALLSYGLNSVSGVYTMSQKSEGLVESSGNLGILEADSTRIYYSSYLRSSENAPENHIVTAAENLAETLGFDVKVDKSSYPWPLKQDNKLRDMAVAIYTEQNGSAPRVVSLHAGLETGRFADMNPNLDMISIGPDVKGAHSIEETLDLESAVKILRLIDAVVINIAE